MSKQYAVHRKPSLMEDEGHTEFIWAFGSRETAQAWIDKQAGYFSPTDYYITESKLSAGSEPQLAHNRDEKSTNGDKS